MHEQLIVTGLGAVSPYGWNVQNLIDGLNSKAPSIGDIRRFDASQLRTALGGEVPSTDEFEANSKTTTPAEIYLKSAIKEAVLDAELDTASAALVVGTNFGGISASMDALGDGKNPKLNKYKFQTGAENIARELSIGGPIVVLSLSCASGTAVLVEAMNLIRTNRVSSVIAAGFDELSYYCLAGLSALRATSSEGIFPYDKKRSGTVFSEGAGALVIEKPINTQGRVGNAYAKLLGGALSNDAFHMTAPDKNSEGTILLIKNALLDAGIVPDDIDHINLHGTGTKYNDMLETQTIKAVFGERATSIPATANKGAIGHAMGAAGALETVASVVSISEGSIPATLGLTEQDEECNLNIVTGEPLECDIKYLLKLSYGIGGTNAAVVLGSVDEALDFELTESAE